MVLPGRAQARRPADPFEKAPGLIGGMTSLSEGSRPVHRKSTLHSGGERSHEGYVKSRLVRIRTMTYSKRLVTYFPPSPGRFRDGSMPRMSGRRMHQRRAMRPAGIFPVPWPPHRRETGSEASDGLWPILNRCRPLPQPPARIFPGPCLGRSHFYPVPLEAAGVPFNRFSSGEMVL